MGMQPVYCSPRRTIRSAGLLLAGLATAFGCTAVLPPNSRVGEHRQKSVCANSLTTQALVLNALMTNRNTMIDLITHPLITNSFVAVPSLHFSVADPFVPQVLKYIVRCALGTDQESLRLTTPSTCPGDPRYYTLPGSLGLCRQWATGSPDLACLERVSACVIALNNAEGKRVSLSMLGDPADPIGLQPQPQVPTDTHQPLMTTPVQSFTGCDPPQSGETRDCGWSPDYVGTCTPNQWVSVAAGAPAVDSAGNCIGDPLGQITPNQPMVARACSGINGCDSTDAIYLASSPPGVCDTYPDGPSLGFWCPPAPSPANPNVAYFSVMVGPQVSGDQGSAVPDAISDYPYSFRAAEGDVFSYSEGAFLGNAFNPDAIRAQYVEVDPVTCDVFNRNQTIDGAVFQDMFACPSHEWTTSLGYALHRLCALPNQNCAARVTMHDCFVSGPLDSQCAGVDSTGAYFGCHRDFGPVTFAITTHLNGPCDELRSTDLSFCQRGQGNGGQGMVFDPAASVIASPPLLLNDDGTCTEEQ